MKTALFIRVQAVLLLLLISVFLTTMITHRDRAGVEIHQSTCDSWLTRTNGFLTVTDREPANVSIVTMEDVELRWTVSKEVNGLMNYTVFMGKSSIQLEKMGTTNGTSITVKVEDDVTYYWKITSEKGGSGIVNASEIWSFTVSLEKSSPNQEDDLLPVILGIIFLLIVIILFIFLRYRRKSGEGALKLDLGGAEKVEADIVHAPEAKKTGTTFKPKPLEETATRPMVQPKVQPMVQPMAQRHFDERLIPLERRAPILPARRPTTSFLSLLKAMEMLKQQTAPGRRNDDLRELKIHLPGEDELDMRVQKKEEEVLSLPAPRVLEVSEKQQKVPIDELFLINPGGLLVQHYSLDRETGLNEDVLAGMLTAVKSFMSDSLSMLDKSADAESEINRIDFGKYSVLMASGKSLSLVAITDHEKKEEIMEQLNLCAKVLEKRFGGIIRDWDGDTAKVEDIKPVIERMVKGEFDADDIPV